MSLISDIKYDRYNINPHMIQAIHQLENTVIGDAKSVHIAIQLLETLGDILQDEINKTEILLNENDKDYLFYVYWKSLTSLKDNEGVNFHLAYKSFRNCLSFIPLFFSLIYNACPGPGVPEEIRELL